MPYTSEWVDPELFVEHDGVAVWHIYKNDDMEEGARVYWFTTNLGGGSDNDTHGENGTFDVRDLSTCESDLIDLSPGAIKAAIVAAIDTGELTTWEHDVGELREEDY